MLRAQPAIELAPVGSCHCLYRTDTGAACLLNDTAAMAWRELENGACLEGIAGTLSSAYSVTRETALDDLRAWEADWRRAGFIREPAAPAQTKSLPAAATPTSAALDERAGNDDLDDAVHLTFGRRGAVTVVVRDPVLADLVQVVLRPLLPALDALETERQCRLEVSGAGTSYSVRSGDRWLCRDVARAWARHAVLHTVLTQVCCRWPAASVLHASAVAIGGRAVVIAGASGSGKSTLTAALVNSGALFLSDDLVPLTADRCEVGSFPVALSVKEGSWPTVATLYPELLDAAVFHTRGLQVRYLDLTGGRPVLGIDHEPAALVFPRFEAGADCRMEELPPHAALTGLLRTGTTIEQSSIAQLARLCDQVPAWQISYSDLGEAVRAVRRLVV
jgi:hypothetical protein